MKISRIHIDNFKRFNSIDIDLTNSLTKDVSDKFLILGDNGAGKTTVLQAIALCLSMISGKIRDVSDFDWQGWVPGRYEKWGQPFIEIDVHFTDEEIRSTIEVAEKWIEIIKPTTKVLPPDNHKLTIRLKGQWVEALDENGFAKKENLYQFKGRYYAVQLLKTSPWARDYFSKLPGFFWFDQYRNLATQQIDDEEKPTTSRVSFDIGIKRLRRFLIGWKLNQLSGNVGGADWLMELEKSFAAVFPGRSFSGLEPMHKGGMPTTDEYYFMLFDGKKKYDIEEMSAGEQSVFPLLFESVRQQIRNSVVLIDEVDLNLHPPLAQSLINALSTIGPGCQFVLTTHSEAVTNLISPEEIFRLKGGKLCL